MILLYGNVLLSHPWSQVYLSIFLGLSSHSHPMFLLFFQLLHLLACCFYETVFQLRYLVLHFWQIIIEIIGVDLVDIYFIHLDFYFFHHVSILSFRSLTSCFRIYISFIVNVTLLLMIFVMFTSCFLNSSSNTFLISFAIFSSSREIFGRVAILKEFGNMLLVASH